MSSHLLPQPLGESHGGVEDRTGENEKELLSTVTSHPVDFARLSFQQLREFLEHGVSGLVAVVVVYALELVDVAHDERYRLVQSNRMVPHVVKPLIQGAPVLDLSEA